MQTACMFGVWGCLNKRTRNSTEGGILREYYETTDGMAHHSLSRSSHSATMPCNTLRTLCYPALHRLSRRRITLLRLLLHCYNAQTTHQRRTHKRCETNPKTACRHVKNFKVMHKYSHISGCSSIQAGRHAGMDGGCMHGWKDGWMEGWMEGWLDSWMHGLLLKHLLAQPLLPICRDKLAVRHAGVQGFRKT